MYAELQLPEIFLSLKCHNSYNIQHLRLKISLPPASLCFFFLSSCSVFSNYVASDTWILSGKLKKNQKTEDTMSSRREISNYPETKMFHDDTCRIYSSECSYAQHVKVLMASIKCQLTSKI